MWVEWGGGTKSQHSLPKSQEPVENGQQGWDAVPMPRGEASVSHDHTDARFWTSYAHKLYSQVGSLFLARALLVPWIFKDSEDPYGPSVDPTDKENKAYEEQLIN